MKKILFILALLIITTFAQESKPSAKVALKPSISAQSAQTTIDVKLTITNGTDATAPSRAQLCKAYAEAYGWTAKVKSNGADVDNPESACAFVERHLEQHFLEVVSSVQASAAGEKAKSDERKKLEEKSKGVKTKPEGIR